MDPQDIPKTILQLKADDLNFRDKLIQTGQLSNGYHPEMEAIHNRNAKILAEIIDRIGYPTEKKVGAEASSAAWLVIQHAISQPPFIIRCLKLLEEAVGNGQAEPTAFAYLSDRIAVYQDKEQLYGTQFDWDENGHLSPKPYDSLTRVDARRKTLGLNSLTEQTALLRERAKQENDAPPQDRQERKRAYEAWRKRVGWL